MNIIYTTVSQWGAVFDFIHVHIAMSK